MRKLIIISFLLLLASVSLFSYQYVHFVDHKLHVVFCSVGQGDSILMTTPSGKHIIIDGGPDKRVLDCLASHLPFWERNIDVLLLTHPHADHLNGMHYIVDRYTVKSFVTERLSNKTAGYNGLLEKLQAKHIPMRQIYQGDSFTTGDGVTFLIQGPSNRYLQMTSPHGTIGEGAEFASLITLLQYGTFSALFTGDSQADGLVQSTLGTRQVTILQSPHHGSRTGLTPAVLSSLHPALGIISVGKNSYGHPSPAALALFRSLEIRILRTDQQGDVEITSDGKTWKVE